MNFDLFTAEQEAVQSLSELIAQAKKCQQLHERANMTLPEPLKRMLGMSTNGHKKATVSVPPPERPPTPPGASAEWVCIKAADASPTSVALALLRDGPMVAKDIVDGVVNILPNARPGSVYNLGTRLDGKAITRSKVGWELVNTESAPILYEGTIWAPSAIFGKQELAAHRREAVLHLIKTNRSGVQTSQIIDQLKDCSWVHAPISKELVQDDVEYWVKEGKIKRSGNSKKWVEKPQVDK